MFFIDCNYPGIVYQGTADDLAAYARNGASPQEVSELTARSLCEDGQEGEPWRMRQTLAQLDCPIVDVDPEEVNSQI